MPTHNRNMIMTTPPAYYNRPDTEDYEMGNASILVNDDNDDMDVDDCEMADASSEIEKNHGMDVDDCEMTGEDHDWRETMVPRFSIGTTHSTRRQERRSSRRSFWRSRSRGYRLEMVGSSAHHDAIMTPIPQKRTYEQSFTLVPTFTMDAEDASPTSPSKRNRLNIVSASIDRRIGNIEDLCKSMGALELE